ncbi:HORMA domain-containing protein 1 isoform X4 [Oxyura jamaicensis]|uniref:HORMA domain-containing protein 1 isoform X4 n=1 Tax=Oxyura jamaicensis TaxID=8884 RepID=UPI0015A5C986|nr:HORMA domain-containing protein 1 isoform X4 [Oxyura jamaicensis]
MLRMIVLAVYTHPEDPQTITECYHFKFKYTHNGPLLNFSSKDKGSDSPITCADTKKASILLIRKIYVLMQNLGPLPNDVCLTMKLFYYDEVTPPDYQPPGFKEGECEGMIFEGEPMHLNMGEVPTPFHMLKVKITTDKQRMENADESILKRGDTDLPVQVDRDVPEESQHMDEDPVLDNKVEDKNHVNTSEAQEPSFPREGDDVTKAGENRSLYVSNRQVDHLASKTSELNMSESRTRSGKIFQTYIPAGRTLVQSRRAAEKEENQRAQGAVLDTPLLAVRFSTPLLFGCLMRLLTFKCSFRDLVLFAVKMLWILRENLPRRPVE